MNQSMTKRRVQGPKWWSSIFYDGLGTFLRLKWLKWLRCLSKQSDYGTAVLLVGYPTFLSEFSNVEDSDHFSEGLFEYDVFLI